MSSLIWILIIAVIIIGLVGGYFQLMLFSNLDKRDNGNIFFGAWVFNPDALNEKGKYYKKVIFIYWALVIVLVVSIQLLR